MKAVKLSENIYWVGAVDYDTRTFHGYKTQRGLTYNAYLVLDEKITLIDTVKKTFTDEMLARIKTVTDVKNIDYIISNHAEFDHSGAVKAVADLSGARVLATAAGVKTLEGLYGKLPSKAVAPHEELSTGRYTFSFLPTPMVHWPDNMATFLKDEAILFSNDAFGQHLATSERFDEDGLLPEAMHEAAKYFANIVLPYRSQVAKAAASIKALNVKTIAPSHGIIWRKHTAEILELYDNLCAGKRQDSAVVVYDSMWGNTKTMAANIGAALEEKFKNVYTFNLACDHESDIMTRVMDCGYLAVGSSTLNNGPMPRVAAFLTYLTGLRAAGTDYLAFGTFGWGGGAVKSICAYLDGAGFKKRGELAAQLGTPPDYARLKELI